MEKWTVTHSRELYRVSDWSGGYFDINERGNLEVRAKASAKGCDLSSLVDALVQRGIEPPILFRFEGIIHDRLRFLEDTFDEAIAEHGYQGDYRLAFPIKVNQHRHVVDSLLKGRRKDRAALEVGSKPELVAMLAMLDIPDSLLLCNGYKDAEYIELALMARRLGRRCIIIIEQLHEIELVLQVSQRLNIPAELGLRFKPSAKGQGRWNESGGERAKFGLNAHDILRAIEQLQRAGKPDWLKLLHYHIGSQVTSISAIKRGLKEATRMYTEVARECPSMCFLDVGGGLAVDYDGSRTTFESSMNYTVGEYARDIVCAIGDACRDANLPHPGIITESGRAVMAHHAVLVVEVTHVAPALTELSLDSAPSDHPIIQELCELYHNLSLKNCEETLHDALDLRTAITNHFVLGRLSLRERAFAERLCRHLFAALSKTSRSLPYIPEDFQKLEGEFLDVFFCNFSVFQSLPDFWAISNLFPIMPIRCLSEEPRARAMIADITCDSDGRIDKFIDLKDVARHLRVHYPKGDDAYYLGIFLVGAYQEILGDLHNLFGDTNAVHVHINDDGSYELPSVVEGDTVREVLEYVQYDTRDLIERLRVSIEESVSQGRLSAADSAMLLKRYREALDGYTYLVKEGSSSLNGG